MQKFWNHQGLFQSQGSLPGSINFKAAVTTKFTTDKLDVRGLKRFAIALQIAQVGAGAAGDCKITLNGYVDETPAVKGPTQVISNLDIFTAIDTHPGAGVTFFDYMSFGDGPGSGVIGTITPAATLETKLHCLHFITLTVEVVTQSTAATSCTGTLEFMARD